MSSEEDTDKPLCGWFGRLLQHKPETSTVKVAPFEMCCFQ